MELIAVPVLLFAVSMLVKLAARRRRSDEPAGPAGYAPPTFRIVALGGSGAGKTVFLASLFHALNFRAPGRSYHLQTEPAQRVALAGLYSNVSDTSRPWPRGTRTGETREFVFDCVASDDPHATSVLRMSYLDYAGELLQAEEEPGGTALADLSERIQGAHALLGMIDGYRVLQLLRGEREGREHFRHTLQPMFGFMQDATCPIHLVLTKWDLVRGFGEPADADDEHRLGCVIDALMRYEHIRSLVYVHSRHQIVRLIPVSAVGSSFVELDAAGHVVKRPDGELRPMNLEVPLCAVLPDLFKQVERSLDQSLRRDLNAELRDRIRRDTGAVVSGVGMLLSRPAGAALRLGLNSVLGRDFGNEAALLFVDWLSRPLEHKGRQIAGDRASHEHALAELDRMRRAVLDDFVRSVLKLEAVLPNSQLSHGW